MRRALLICGLSVATLLSAGIAQGELRQVGNLRLAFDGRFTPHALPRDRDVPVTVELNGSVRTTDGTVPPQLRSMSIAVNRYGKLSTEGLPTCRPSSLEATSSKEALARCRSALVGRGRFGANVDFPNIAFPVKGQMLAFNSRGNGRPTIALHVHGSNPVEATFVLIFRITHPAKGRYGSVLSTRIPKIASDLGYVTDLSLTFGRRYRHNGEARSFISARCAAPAGFPAVPFLFAKGSFDFADGRTLTSQLTRDCRVVG
ncbi:MAG TPA: hypothetical protein VNP96_07080 [Solirubrobacterales bacterium]|nr:hypothetical protein [Solirubrobacterales bacterium]